MISVIVPVYNVEEYLDQCIQSILNQSYKDIEIILVNDGSKDKSLNICKKYQENDFRIKVIDKENGGLSSARNAGLRIATGDYVVFIDSDDYWDNLEGLEILVNLLNSHPVDILNFHFKKLNENNNSIVKCFNEVKIDELYKLVSIKDKVNWMISNSQYISSACNKLIKRELIEEFEYGVLSEDIEWAYKLLINASSIGISNLDFYVYRQRKGSITHTVGDKHINDLIKTVRKMIDLSEEIDDIEFKRICDNYIAFQYATILINIHYTKKETRRKYYAQIKELSYLLKNDLDSKVHKLNLVYKYLGFEILYLFTKVFAKVRK